MFYLGFYVRFDAPKENAPIPAAGYVALVMVYIFAAAFQFGWGPVCWIYVSEIPTNRLRGYNVSLAAATQWLFNLVVARVTPVMLVKVGGSSGYGTYFIYGSFCFTMGVLAFWVPETKGVSSLSFLIKEVLQAGSIYINYSVFSVSYRFRSNVWTNCLVSQTFRASKMLVSRVRTLKETLKPPMSKFQITKSDYISDIY
jgi:hypothetical protein